MTPSLSPPPHPGHAFKGHVLPAIGLAALLSATVVHAAPAQYRFGLSFGGASTVALVVEYRRDHQGLEVQAGTWQFRDLSLSVTARQYVGSHAAEPFVGAGLWAIVAWAEEGTGYGLIGRIPTGFTWEPASRHSVALTIYLNRALALKRPDPENRRPPRKALVPLPEFSYRWRSGN